MARSYFGTGKTAYDKSKNIIIQGAGPYQQTHLYTNIPRKESTTDSLGLFKPSRFD